ncbi:MAG TPA: carboxyltransferase domain-containing protein, partial [Myxococcota bacterium]|nr:carboxyltransferase domain-containing protein [Myxococcota bacterium]
EALARETAQDAAIAGLAPVVAAPTAEKPSLVPADTVSATVLAALPAQGDRPAVAYRQAGDRYILLEYGPNELDLRYRFRVHALMEELKARPVAGILELSPGVRSLLDDPSTCLLCDDSPSAVARALEELFGDGRRMERIARAGLASASRLSVESMCRQFEEILVHHALGTRDD